MTQDNEILNEYWEFKLDFEKPKQCSQADEVWKFIQNKYVKKMYVPKNVADPATEFRNGSTEHESHDLNETRRPKKVHKIKEIPIEKKSAIQEVKTSKDINDILDIDFGTKENINLEAKSKSKIDSYWGIFEHLFPSVEFSTNLLL